MKRDSIYYQYNFADVYGEEWEHHPNPMKNRTEDQQINLADIYDRSILGEENREEFIHRKMKSLGRGKHGGGIVQRTILSGDRVEIDFYPYFLNRSDIPRGEKVKEARRVQKALNDKNSRKHLVRLLCTNFHRGDLILTLTYRDGEYPDEDRAKKDMRNYIAALKRARKKQKLPALKYIYVIEYAEEGEHTKKIRFHHHIIINRMDRALAESLWKKGRVRSDIAQPDDFELEGFARYISKMSGKKGHHKWCSSKNLDKPKEYKSITKLSRRRFAEIIKAGDERAELIESLYGGRFKYLDSTVYINQEYGGFYLYSRLRRRESVWKEEEMQWDDKGTAAGEETAPDKGNNMPGGNQEKTGQPRKHYAKCRAFIDYEWKGTLANGTAEYSIILEAVVRGKPYTEMYHGRVTGTTKNRAVLYMAKKALGHLRPCEVEFYVDSNYLVRGINTGNFRAKAGQGLSGVKNGKLIRDFLSAGRGFEMSAVNQKKHEYSSYLQMMRKKYKGALEEIKDEREDEGNG